MANFSLIRRINCWFFILVALGKITSLTRLVLGRTHQPFVPHELGSSWTWTRWIKGCPSCSLNVPSLSRSILLHMFWTSPFNASLSFFALTLVIGPIGTSNGSLAWLRLVLGWSASKGFNKRLMNCPLNLFVIQGRIILKRERMIWSKQGKIWTFT